MYANFLISETTRRPKYRAGHLVAWFCLGFVAGGTLVAGLI